MLFFLLLLFIILYYFITKFSYYQYFILSHGVVCLIRDKDIFTKVFIMDELLNRMYKLKYYLIENIHTMPKYSSYIQQLYSNLSPSRTNIYENDINNSYTSYSVNKGMELYVCLRNKTNGELHDINVLTYVLIHEMAHIACPDIGHSALFYDIFNKFIEEAIKIGVYDYHDYSKVPLEYCGIIIR